VQFTIIHVHGCSSVEIICFTFTCIYESDNTLFAVFNVGYDVHMHCCRQLYSLHLNVIHISMNCSVFTLQKVRFWCFNKCVKSLLTSFNSSSILLHYGRPRFCLPCFDAVGWASGRASGL